MNKHSPCNTVQTNANKNCFNPLSFHNSKSSLNNLVENISMKKHNQELLKHPVS